MPAKSKSQQRFMGMVHAYQKGELDNASPEIRNAAKNISYKDAKDFAETKHKGLPKHAHLLNLGFHKSAETSYVKDFLAGVEPTGKFTFQNAQENQKNHGLHRLAGNIGGMVGGGLIAIGTGAAGLYTGGKLLSKMHKNSRTAKTLMQAGKEQLAILNPFKVKKTFSNYREANDLFHQKLDLMNYAQNYKGGPIKDTLNRAMQAKQVLARNKAFEARVGDKAEKVVQRAYTMMGGAAAAGLGGGMNALSAHVQYGAGKAAGEKLRNDKQWPVKQ